MISLCFVQKRLNDEQRQPTVLVFVLQFSGSASKLDRSGQSRIFPPRGKMPMNRTTLWARACAAAIMLSSAVCAQTVTYTYSYAGPALPIFRDSANIITGVSVFVPKAITISKATVEV